MSVFGFTGIVRVLHAGLDDLVLRLQTFLNVGVGVEHANAEVIGAGASHRRGCNPVPVGIGAVHVLQQLAHHCVVFAHFADLDFFVIKDQEFGQVTGGAGIGCKCSQAAHQNQDKTQYERLPHNWLLVCSRFWFWVKGSLGPRIQTSGLYTRADGKSNARTSPFVP